MVPFNQSADIPSGDVSATEGIPGKDEPHVVAFAVGEEKERKPAPLSFRLDPKTPLHVSPSSPPPDVAPHGELPAP